MKEICKAKLNLDLRVIAKREDGYHQLVTTMSEINIGDVLTVLPATEDRFICDLPSIAEDNLVMKALLLLRQIRKVPPLHIILEKKIPIASGMGGGSSNAATFLSMVNREFSLALTKEELETLAVQLGMDVTFFLYGGLVRAEGRGELLFPLEGKMGHALVVYRVPSSSKEVYEALTEEDIQRDCSNTLWDVALRINPKLREFSTELQRLDPRFTMSGAGGSFFLLDHDLETLEKYKTKIDAPFREIVELKLP
ncbi:MAG: hypothetical protein Q4Q17_03465 [Tissierellia bacterium]|nr:hypothetical protein [Tissierellia bacterium]